MARGKGRSRNERLSLLADGESSRGRWADSREKLAANCIEKLAAKEPMESEGTEDQKTQRWEWGENGKKN